MFLTKKIKSVGINKETFDLKFFIVIKVFPDGTGTGRHLCECDKVFAKCLSRHQNKFTSRNIILPFFTKSCKKKSRF